MGRKPIPVYHLHLVRGSFLNVTFGYIFGILDIMRNDFSNSKGVFYWEFLTLDNFYKKEFFFNRVQLLKTFYNKLKRTRKK